MIWIASCLCGACLFMMQALYRTSHIFQAMLWGVGAFFLSVIAWTDLKEHRIPNILVGLLLIFQTLCLLADWSGFGTSVVTGVVRGVARYGNLPNRLAGILVPMLIVLILNRFYPGGLGAGDGKLYLVLGFTMGFEQGMWIMFGSVLFLAAIALFDRIVRRLDHGNAYPMAPAILAAYLVIGCL